MGYPRLSALACLASLSAAAVSANVAVKPPFAASMVLQRNMANPVWGTAAAGEAVTVSIGGQSKTVTAAAGGKWQVKLDPMEAAGPLTLKIVGSNTVTLGDVYIGEVWQVAGQSNMDTRLSFYPNLADSIKHADMPLLRYYTLRQPGETTTWLVVSPATAGKLSATGYFFGKQIQKTTGVAVGLVVTAVGGTTIESWLDPVTLSANPAINTADRGGNWNTWVANVAGFGLRGTVWIQGEQNCTAAGAPTYGERFKLLIKGWRAAWGQGDFPFYYGQLSSTTGAPDPNNVSYVAQVREGQRLALALPATAMSVHMDIGSGGWHFPDKPTAGFRLSLPAKALLYGQKDVVYSGPVWVSLILAGNKAKLVFAHTEGGLAVKGAVTGFAIAAAGGKWVWGDAVISGDTVIVSAAGIDKPAKVRYAWSDNPNYSLYNGAGLPASPFTTEGEPGTVAMGKRPAHAGAAMAVGTATGDVWINPMGRRSGKAAGGISPVPVFRLRSRATVR